MTPAEIPHSSTHEVPVLPAQESFHASSHPLAAADHHTVFDDITAIERLLLRRTTLREATTSLHTNGRLKKVIALSWLSAATTLTSTWFVPPVIGLLLLSVALVNALVCGATMAVLIVREWQQRDTDTTRALQTTSKPETELIRELLPFSRSALLHVAATLRAAERRVGSRISMVLGQNRNNGLFGAFFLILGSFTAARYLQDHQVVVPLLHLPVSSWMVIVLATVLFSLAAGVLIAELSVSALLYHAELLERTATLKKNLAEKAA